MSGKLPIPSGKPCDSQAVAFSCFFCLGKKQRSRIVAWHLWGFGFMMFYECFMYVQTKLELNFCHVPIWNRFESILIHSDRVEFSRRFSSPPPPYLRELQLSPSQVFQRSTLEDLFKTVCSLKMLELKECTVSYSEKRKDEPQPVVPAIVLMYTL